jgi:hypothetical protein
MRALHHDMVDVFWRVLVERVLAFLRDKVVAPSTEIWNINTGRSLMVFWK